MPISPEAGPGIGTGRTRPRRGATRGGRRVPFKHEKTEQQNPGRNRRIPASFCLPEGPERCGGALWSRSKNMHKTICQKYGYFMCKLH